MTNRAHVLVIDDEPNIRRALRMVLEDDYEVNDAASAADAERRLRATPEDALFLDVRLGDASGLDLLDRLRKGELGRDAATSRFVPVIMVSGHASIGDAVRATKNGAFDFLEKPLDQDRVLITLRNALELATLRKSLAGKHQMIGNAPVMEELYRQIAKVAPTKGRVLITGESGSGKELIARAIHDASAVARGPFVKVNCAAIPAELIESELFGHERGAFTGAVAQKRGLFEVAVGGTIFLDEIGDMSLSAQAKVLRVLQSGELVRVGGEKVLHVDCRALAATNRSLEEDVAAGRFREDLFFRLNVIPMRCPPLRERIDDIPALVEHFAAVCCDENGFGLKFFDPEVIQRLKEYAWPGNVRELKNVIERMVILSEATVTVADLDACFGPRPAPRLPEVGADLEGARGRNLTLREFRDEAEKEFILLRLREHDWNISRTAQVLGIERTNLHKKLKALGIEREP